MKSRTFQYARRPQGSHSLRPCLKLRQICAIRIDLLKERGLLVIERCEAFACFQIRELLLGIGKKLVCLICLPLEEPKCPLGGRA